MKVNTLDHPKRKRLSLKLGLTRRDTCGLLEVLWHLTAKFAPQGDIGAKMSDLDLAIELDWPGDQAARLRGLPI